MIGFIIGLFIGALAGFLLCAILTASKIGALQDRIDELNYVRKAYRTGLLMRSTTIIKED